MYTLKLRARARANLRRLDATIRERVLNKLDQLCKNCETYPHKALKGGDRGKFSLKMQDYRTIYSFNREKQEVIVHRIGHRSSVY